MSVIVIEFVTLDGVVFDPEGSAGTPYGGWAFRHGPEAVAGDKFQLGPSLDDGVLLLGRRTWQLFAGLWPSRTDEFSMKMNAVPKLVVSRTAPDVSAWSNSVVLADDAEDAVRRESRPVIVAGSLSVVTALQRADLVDEYRLLTFPTVAGDGQRLFAAAAAPSQLELISAERMGPVVLSRYRRPSR